MTITWPFPNPRYQRAATIASGAALLQAVGKDKNGIGYGGIAYGAGAKHLSVKKDADSKAIEPTEENVLNASYPIWRYLYIYLNPALDKGEIADYLKCNFDRTRQPYQPGAFWCDLEEKVKILIQAASDIAPGQPAYNLFATFPHQAATKWLFTSFGGLGTKLPLCFPFKNSLPKTTGFLSCWQRARKKVAPASRHSSKF